MKYKVFVAVNAEKLEQKVMAWIEEAQVKDVFHSDTKFTTVPGKEGGQVPLFTVGLWYRA